MILCRISAARTIGEIAHEHFIDCVVVQYCVFAERNDIL